MISRASKSSILQGFAKSRSMLAGNAAYDPGSYYLIERINVGSGGASSVTFSSIPQTYKHLQIRMIAKSGTVSGVETTLLAQFNSNTTYTNYYGRHILYGDGSNAAAAANNSSGYVGAFAGIIDQQATSNTFAASILDILDYTNTNKNKVTRVLAGTDRNGAGTMVLGSGLWINTAAITSISIVPLQNTIAQYSTFALYGSLG
jgi:hypothetical protein